jgi:23S rRNA pseudouridine1911/1915/1917 synthase
MPVAAAAPAKGAAGDAPNWPEILIADDDSGQRLDRYLRKRLAGMPLSHLHKLLRTGKVFVNGVRVKDAEHRIEPGSRLQVQMDGARFVADAKVTKPRKAPDEATLELSRKQLPVLFRDEDVLIINKPAGLLVHPGAGHYDPATIIEMVRAWPEFADLAPDPEADRLALAALADELDDDCPESGSEDDEDETENGGGARQDPPAPNRFILPATTTRLFRPSLCHRLDKDTSGALVIALTGRALRDLTALFRRRPETRGRTLFKEYVAVVSGRIDPPEGEIREGIIRRDAPHAGAQRVRAVREGGKASLTRYRTLASHNGTSVVALELATGRTHQIRAHLMSKGCPIIGDDRYTQPKRAPGFGARAQPIVPTADRQMLHAYRVVFSHPASLKDFEVTAPLPKDMQKLLGRLGYRLDEIAQALATRPSATGLAPPRGAPQPNRPSSGSAPRPTRSRPR